MITYSTFVLEINVYQTNVKSHVCVVGEKTSLNMQEPATGQKYVMERTCAYFVKLIISNTNYLESQIV